MAMNVAKSLGLKKKPVAAKARLPRAETVDSEDCRWWPVVASTTPMSTAAP